MRTGWKAAPSSPRGVEKSSPSSQLGKDSADLEEQQKKSPPRLQVELVCQDETRSFDPFWDGPRLVPSFVAQVLGQAMPERRETHVLARTPYGSAALRQALLVDRKS